MRGTQAKAGRRERAAFTPEIDPIAVLNQIATEVVVLEDGRTLRHPFEGPGRADRRRSRSGEKHRVPGHVTSGGGMAVLDIVGHFPNGAPKVVARRGWDGFSTTKAKPWAVKKARRARSKIQKASRRKNRPA